MAPVRRAKGGTLPDRSRGNRMVRREPPTPVAPSRRQAGLPAGEPASGHGARGPSTGGSPARTAAEVASGSHAGLARVTRVKIAVCVKQVPDAAVHKRLDPATQPARPLGRGRAQRDRRQRRRGGAAAARRRTAARSSSSRSGPRRRWSRCGRRSRWARTARCSSPTTPRPAPTSSRRATRSRRRSSARRPISSSSASSRATPTARCSGPRSPTGCAARWSRRWPS